ncbi:MAG: M20/M25/M40 family metallo-hydrolase [Defluviitaleaceae bacterium]|nr:M20/M25/M40 family metallo-hydrolase [Defluviitaleaceae bacterium]
MTVQEITKYFTDIADYSDLDKDKIAKILSTAITFPTVSYEDEALMDSQAFKDLHAFFEDAFPLVHKYMERIVINEWSLIFHWKGSDTSLKPALFMAHLDVVPVSPGTEGDWTYPPFSGHIDGDFIWGRGAIDTKSQVVGELFAAEYLLEKNYTPKRDIYFVFGHDEETMGVKGALACKEYLEKKGVTLEFVMDEGGGFKMGGEFGAPNALLARVDIFEKGYIDVAVEGEGIGGHSSKPGKGTVLGKVSKAISKIEDNQLPAHLNPVTANMFKALAPVITEEPFKSYVSEIDTKAQAFADYLCSVDSLAPMVHTTTALTMINGSPAPNVLPQSVKALINFRIAPEDTCESVLKHCIDTANDPELNIYMTKGLDPSKMSRIDSVGYKAIEEATKKFLKDITVLPGLVVGGTDCRYFEDICDSAYRFRPYMDNMVLGYTTHSTNERCYTPGLVQGVKIIIEVMVKTCF